MREPLKLASMLLNSHTGRNVDTSACKATINEMLGPGAAKEKITQFPGVLMTCLQTLKVWFWIRIRKKFALQLNESTDVSGLCVREERNTTGEEIFRVTSEYLEKEDLSGKTLGVCPDGEGEGEGKKPRCDSYALFFTP